jgi:tetratricopeptide (TPR) repeat protein
MRSLQSVSCDAPNSALHLRTSSLRSSVALRTACTALLLGLLAACAPPPPMPAADVRPAVPAPREMVAQVRAAGVSNASELEVTPLRDPQVGDLLDRAAKLESKSDYPGAAQAIAKALTLLPDDPELLQQAAEFALYQQDWKQTESFAQQSFDHGPKLGSLCRRNWTTLRFVRLARGDVAGVQAAIHQAATCAVEPPVRM